MTNLQMWSLLVGFLAPLVIAVIQQPKWKQSTRALVTAICSIVGGGLTAYFEGSFDDKSDVIGSILLVGVAAMTFYAKFWKQTRVAPAIEALTSPNATVRVIPDTNPEAVIGKNSDSVP